MAADYGSKLLTERITESEKSVEVITASMGTYYKAMFEMMPMELDQTEFLHIINAYVQLFNNLVAIYTAQSQDIGRKFFETVSRDVMDNEILPHDIKTALVDSMRIAFYAFNSFNERVLKTELY